MSSTKNFGITAQKLARNPLGIIALFIVLIYGIACLTFGLGKQLSSLAVCFFVAFILIYPFTVLGVFYRLVTKHHTKLYAPQDFPRPEDFVSLAYGDQDRYYTKKEIIDLPAEALEIDVSEKINVSEAVNIEPPKVFKDGEKK